MTPGPAALRPVEATTFPSDGEPLVLDINLGSQFDGAAEDEDQYAERREDMLGAYRATGLPDDHSRVRGLQRRARLRHPLTAATLNELGTGLRHIHQLALTYLVYPGATHRRFEHSLGGVSDRLEPWRLRLAGVS